MSIANCLTKLKINPKHEDAILAGLAASARAGKLDSHNAAVFAVSDALTEAEAERADIVAQVEAQGVEVYAKAVLGESESNSDLDYTDRIHTLDVQDDVIDRAIEGDITLDEFKASFDGLLKNKMGILAELEKMTKPQIFKRFPALEYRYKSEKKDRVVHAAFMDMLDSFALGESISYSMGDKYEDVIRRIVDRTTDEQLAKFAEGIRQRRAERAEALKARTAGMDDPQTLDDYDNLIRAKAAEIGEGATIQQVRMMLSPEQRARYDELASEKSRTERLSRKDAQRTEVHAAAHATTGDIIETKHTKTGEPLFVVKAAERVEKDVYNQWNATAKRMGGWYSSFKGAGAVPGFQFKTREGADAFLKYLGGNVDEVKQAVQDRRDVFKDDRSQSAVERLTEMADALDEKADASMSVDRKANTSRRARFAASAEAAASSGKAMAQTMRNIATAIKDGSAKLLDQVRQKVQVEMLQGFVTTAHADMQREKYPAYVDLERHRGEKPTPEVADYAQFPSYTAYRSDIASLGRSLLESEGTKKLGARLMSVADDVTDTYLAFAKENLHKVSAFTTNGGAPTVFKTKGEAEASIARSGYMGRAIVLPFKRGENLIVLSPSESVKRGIWDGDNDKRITLRGEFGAELVEQIGKAARRGAKVSVPWQFENTYDKRKRLAGIGIETPAELRAALREFIGLREVAAAPDKVKELERAMVGRSNDGLDFFPTPAGVVDEMIEAADIKEGMTVLEPSAGMGHIAERIRAAGIEPDVVELSGGRRELLEAKGFNLVGDDFMDATGEYDRILMNPPFGDRRDAAHVQHAFSLLKPGGRMVAIVGEGVFFGKDKAAQDFRDWLDQVGATDEKLPDGSFRDPSLSVNTGVAARMVVIDKQEGGATLYSRAETPAVSGKTVADFQPLADKVNAKLGDGYEVVVVQSEKDLPQGAQPLYQAAYHGSPYKFDKFSLEHMGKGEGAQAYGWGLYFAGNKEVAEYYRKTLTNRRVSIIGISRDDAIDSIDIHYSGEIPAQVMRTLKKIVKDRIDYAITLGERYGGIGMMSSNARVLHDTGQIKYLVQEKHPKLAQDFDVNAVSISDKKGRYGFGVNFGNGFVKDYDVIKKHGQLYKVEIPEDDTMLLWDKPLSEQPTLMAALRKKDAQKVLSDAGIGFEAFKQDGNELYNRLVQHFTNHNSALRGSLSHGSQEAASKYLHSLGINGIKYLDGTSRSAGEGSFNYVIFDDNAIEIAETYFSKDSGAIEGAYVGGKKVYIVADAIHTEQRFDEVLRHELLHLAKRMTIESAEWKRAEKTVQMMERAGNKLVNELAFEVDRRQSGLGFDAQSIKALDAIKDEKDKNNKPTKKAIRAQQLLAMGDSGRAEAKKRAESTRTEEILAMAQETGRYKESSTLVKLFADIVRAFKRIALKMGIKGAWFEKMGIEEVFSMMRAGERALYRDSGVKDNLTTGDYAPAYSANPFDGIETPKTELGSKTEIEVDGVMRPALNSNGKPIHWSEEGVRNFWRWFAGSSVTDEQGRPLVVYRGESRGETPTEYHPHLTNERAVFFTPDKEIARVYARGNDIAELYIKSNNVIDLTQDNNESRKFINLWSKEFDEWIDRQSGESVDPTDEVFGGRLFDYEGDWSGERWKSLQTAALEDHDAAILPDWDNDKGVFSAIISKGGTQIKSATGNNGAFNPRNPSIVKSESAPWYYSALAKAIKTAPERVFNQPAQGFKAWIQSNSDKMGVKKDELHWTGLLDWLDTQGKARVSREQVGEYLAQGGVQLQETVLGDDPRKTGETARRDELNRMSLNDLHDEAESYGIDPESGNRAELIATIIENEISESDETAGKDTKYSGYKLKGGENYREFVLTLPSNVSMPELKAVYIGGGEWKVTYPDGKELTSIRAGSEKEAISTAWNTGASKRMAEQISGRKDFTSSHWPGIPNPVAHMRVDTVKANGKTYLRVIEVQSDHGQDGRKKGFGDAKRFAELRKQMAVFEDRINKSDLDEAAALMDIPEYAKLAEEAKAVNPEGKVPSAPFVQDTKAWTSLVIKRAIALAAKEGMDGVVFASGQESADLYDLSKQISAIQYYKGEDGLYELRADSLIGKTVVDESSITADRVEEIVGKDMLKKMDAGEGKKFRGDWKELSGLDLKVGGEGMRAFYDQIIPQVANDVLKKVGAGVKVETVEADTKRLGFTITQEFADKVNGEGLPLFSRQVTMDDAEELLRLLNEDSGSIVESKELTENEADIAEAVYLSNFPTGTRKRNRRTKLARSLRQASDDAANDLGGKATAKRIVDSRLGAFSSYSTSAKIDKDGTINVEVWGKEQVDQGLTKEPALTFSVSPKGEIIVNGPNPLGQTFKEFEARGWAERATAKGEIVPGWTRLAEKLPMSQVIPLIGEVHARTRLNKRISHIGLNWHRSTGMLGLTDPDGGAIFFSRAPAQSTAIPRQSTAIPRQSTAIPRQSTAIPKQQEIVGNSGRQLTKEQMAAMQRTGFVVTKKSIKETIRKFNKGVWRKMAQGIADQFRPVRDLDDHAYTLLRLSKGATGAFEALMNYGKLSIKDGATDADMSGGVLEKVFYPIGKESTEFLMWVAGNRAEHLKAQGKERLFTNDDISAFKSLSDGNTNFDYKLEDGSVTRDRKKIYQDTLNKYNEFNKNVLDIAEQSSLIDGESREMWENEFYVPFYRVAEEAGDDVEARGMYIKSGVMRQEAFKKLKGGTDKLNDLLANTLMNWAHLIDASAKNRAAKATMDAAMAAGVAHIADTSDTKTMWYMYEGEKIEIAVDDPEIVNAISALEYAGIRGPMMDILSAPKRWLTIGVTASPFFKVRNLIRDSVQAIATADLSYNPAQNIAEGFRLTNRKTPVQEYVSALAGGGLIRFGTMLEGSEAGRVRQIIKQGAKDEHILDDESKIRAFYDKYLEPTIAAYNELGNRGEEINRMALYHQLRAQGQDHATASLMARDLMDFSMQGTWSTIRFLSQLVPFFNARIQGMYKLGRAARQDKARFAIVIGAVSLMSLALLAAYGDDDDWKRREDWDRDNYWWFKLGGIAFRIPKPFEVGAIATLAERTAEMIFDSEMTGERFKSVTTSLVTNQLSMNPVPQTFKPLIDLYANTDSFSKRPIESMGMERYDPSYRYNQSTSMVARGVSEAGNFVTGENFLSPVQIDFLLKSYFGWLGATAVSSADMIVRGVSNEPTRPALDYWKWSTGGMVSKLDGAQSRYVSLMYEQAKELEMAHATYNKLRKEGRVEAASEYRAAHTEDLKKYKNVEGVKKAIGRINERIRIIERSSADAETKRGKIDALRNQQNKIASRMF